ncbi:AMP-binding protein [Streptomyces sp. NPDC059063]|uniref:class I adenylate-forming enzyme family protein n=1 Tax=unclassified Streptomyces TaxID=2593676 RepID=UPI003692B0C2
MKGSTAYASIQKRGLHLGLLPQMAAAVNPTTPIHLDHDLDALPEAGRHLTIAQYAAHVADLAARLKAAGVQAGEHVVIHKKANADHWMLAAAVSRIGAIVVNLSPALDPQTVAVLLERIGRPTLLTDGATHDRLSTELDLPSLTQRVITSAQPRPATVFLGDLADAQPATPVLRPIDEPAVITHTSGTTGIPKLVVHTPRTQGIRLVPQWRLLSLLRGRQTVAIHIPFVHSRMVAAMTLALLKQYPLLLMREKDPAQVADQLLTHRPALIEALPNSLMEWEQLTNDPRAPFASVKVFSSTFDAIHPATMSRLLNASHRRGALFFQIYGQSEVGPAVGRAYFRRTAHKANGRCVGWPMPHGAAKIRVVPRNNQPPTPQNPGRIEVAWPGLAPTYHGEQHRYNANRNGPWWQTGDIGYRTRYGCLHLLDRETDMIPGIHSTLHIEDTLLAALPELTELVIIQGPHNQPVPVITTHNDTPLNPDRWHTATTPFPQLTTPLHIPHNQLPRTATLKVQRHTLTQHPALKHHPTHKHHPNHP